MATERKIGAHVYRCEKLPASDALPLFVKVTKLFRAAPKMLDSFSGDPKEAKTAFVILLLSGDFEPGHIAEFLSEIVATCVTGGERCIVGFKPQDFEETIEVAWFAMEVQFGSFLRASLV